MEDKFKKVRTFIAIRLSDKLTKNLDVFTNKLKNLQGNYRWMDPAQTHLTLHFLGDIDTNLVPGVMAACQKAVREIPPMRLQVSGCGVFPNFRQPRVLWVGVADETKNLAKLHAALAEQLTALGLELEKRSFSPHLTLARIKFLKKTGALKQVVEKNRSEFVGELVAQKITVYKSELTPAGPEYTILGETYFKGDLDGQENRF